MRILSLHIEGFGKFVNCDFEFDAGLNSHIEPNGEGKTTRCEFILAMIYGLGSIKKENTARAHFAPLGTGKYGGRMKVLYEGSEYTVERYFGTDSITKDKCRLLNSRGEQLPIDSKGEELYKFFNLYNKDTYQRSLFITSDNLTVGESIGKSIVELIVGNDKTQGYDKTKAILKEKISSFTSKAKDGPGYPKLEEKMRELEEGIEYRKSLVEIIIKADEDIKAIEDMLADCRKRKSAFDKLSGFSPAMTSLEEQRAKMERDKQSIENKYPHGMPNTDDIIILDRCSQAYSEKKTELKNTVPEEADSVRLEELRDTFRTGAPLGDEIEEIGRACKRLEDLSEISEPAKSRELCELDGKFAEADVIEVSARAEQLKSTAEQKSAEAWKSPIPLYVILLSYIIPIAVGTALVGVSLPLAAVMIAVGAMMGTVLALICLISKRDVSAASKEKSPLEKFLEVWNEPSIDIMLYNLKRYKELAEEYRSTVEEYVKKHDERKGLERELSEYFLAYGIDTYDTKSALQLRDMANEYRRLSRGDSEKARRREELRADMEQIISDCREIIEKYALSESTESFLDSMSALSILRDDIRGRDALIRDIGKIDADIAKNREEMADTIALTEGIDESALDAAIDEQQRHLNECRDKVSRDREDFNELPQMNERRQALKEETEALKSEKECYELALKYLEESRKDMVDRYVEPMKQKFIYYANTVNDKFVDNLSMQSDFDISYERHGQSLESRQLSTGESALCALCLRLALADTLYSGREMPFMVLDDPFSELDADNLCKAVNLVRSLAGTRQIFYLTCHKSREIV